MKIQAAIAYKDSKTSLATLQANLVLWKGHFTVLTDQHFMETIPRFKVLYKCPMDKAASPLNLDDPDLLEWNDSHLHKCSPTRIQLPSESVSLLIPQRHRCDECEHESFLQVGTVTRCLQCRKVTVAKPPQWQNLITQAPTAEHNSEPQATQESETSLPLHTYEAQNPLAIQGLDRSSDSTQLDDIKMIPGIKEKVGVALMDFFHEFGGSVSKNPGPNTQTQQMSSIAQPYYGTGRPLEPEVNLRLEYGDTRWEIAICVHQTY